MSTSKPPSSRLISLAVLSEATTAAPVSKDGAMPMATKAPTSAGSTATSTIAAAMIAIATMAIIAAAVVARRGLTAAPQFTGAAFAL